MNLVPPDMPRIRPANPLAEARAIFSAQASGTLLALARRVLDPTAPHPYAPRNHAEEIDAVRAAAGRDRA